MKGTSPFQGVEIAGASVDRCLKALNGHGGSLEECWGQVGIEVSEKSMVLSCDLTLKASLHVV